MFAKLITSGSGERVIQGATCYGGWYPILASCRWGAAPHGGWCEYGILPA